MDKAPELHVVAGPNGIGKTTVFTEVIPHGLDYLNADLIAKTIKQRAGGLNAQDIANGEASKIFFERVARKESFAIETNLYDIDTYRSFQGLQRLGYKIYIYFLATDDVNLCINRVKLRVSQGGHNVNPDIIRQRYTTGLALLKHYKNFPDALLLLDNTEGLLVTQLELHKGLLKYKSHLSKPWTEAIFQHEEDADSTKTASQKQSIEEVRDLYKKGISKK